MTSAKVAISLPRDLLARVRAAVKRGEATSLSAYVTHPSCSARSGAVTRSQPVTWMTYDAWTPRPG
ncbi:MAG TPA: hypothetical protein VJN18_06660 [Polyangiaceae bacterium]|nr:hypothetical protein [Polyangiaceae bacterium]